MKYRFIRRHEDDHCVVHMCEALEVSPSGYYDWLKRPPSKRALEDKRLLGRIREIHVGSRRAYGADKTWHELRAQGEHCGRHRVARLRREHGIEAERKRRFRRSYAARNNEAAAPNMLQRDFRVSEPNTAWVSDTTFVPTRRGWLYLAIVLDLYSRRIVGWSMSERNDRRLVIDALTMAIDWRRPGTGLIHHSDQGIQYGCSMYRELLNAHAMIQSMSRKGNCLDNAVAESFFSNLKNELVHHCTFNNREEARTAIFDYIELFYNRQRRHQYLGYRSPEEFEMMSVA